MADYRLFGDYKGYGGAQKEAEAAMLKKQLVEAQIMKQQQSAAGGLGSDAPANVQEYQFYSQLSPENQAKFIQMKRADKYLDTGGGFVRPNPITNEATPVTAPGGAPIQKVLPPKDQPQNIEDEIENKLRTEELYKAEQNLPNMEAKTNAAIKQIDAVLNDPALGRAVGTVSSRLPNVRGSTAAFENRIKQLQGGVFLEAFQSLKDGGPITELEGAKAEAAISRMQLATSEEEFKAALNEFKASIAAGVQRQKDRMTELKKQSYSKQGAIDAPAEDLNIGDTIGGFNAPSTVKLKNPPTQAVQALKADPSKAAEFDAYYGKGASKMVLGR